MNSTTWSGKPTTHSSDVDPIDDALADLVRAAQHNLGSQPKVKAPGARDRGELVERSDFVTFVLLASGYCTKDFKVKIARDILTIEAPDFELTRQLGCRVHPAGAKTDYRNGVLSIRIPKKF